MSGSQTPPGNAGTPAVDPSMEDILASIRRILSEEEPAPGAAPNKPEPEPEPPPAEPPPEEDVLVLDSSMMVEEAPPAAEPEPEAEPPPAPVVAAAPIPLPEPETRPPEPAPPPVPDLELLAPAAAAAATSSVSTLVRTLAAERATQVHRGGPTIEDLVREEIRPLLKEWLDTHLPPLVERLVRVEIERVVGRAVP
jgi:cell pole-organizing protein PopZ